MLSTLCSAALFFSCTRRFRNVSLQQRSRLKDVQAPKRTLTLTLTPTTNPNPNPKTKPKPNPNP